MNELPRVLLTVAKVVFWYVTGTLSLWAPYIGLLLLGGRWMRRRVAK